MRTSIRYVTTLALGAALAACGGSPATVDEELARDLKQIAGSSLELAPAGQGTQVMSAIEQAPQQPKAAPAPAPTRARVAQSTTRPPQQQVRTPAPAPRAPERAPAPAAEAQIDAPAAAAPRPANPPLGAGAPPPGGWRNVNDVIRNSRVPINP